MDTFYLFFHTTLLGWSAYLSLHLTKLIEHFVLQVVIVFCVKVVIMVGSFERLYSVLVNRFISGQFQKPG